MTAESISQLALLTSLVSALIAAWSLRDSKEARAENRKFRLLNRKTELLILLSDVQLKATETRFLAFDCLDVAMSKDLFKSDEGAPKFDAILEGINITEAIKKEIDTKKAELDNTNVVEAGILERLFAEYSGKIREMENQAIVLKRIDEWARGASPPSVL